MLVAWDPTLEKILVAFKALSGWGATANHHYGLLCYFNSGKTDLTINDSAYNISTDTSNERQLVYDSGSERFVYTYKSAVGVLYGRFLTCGGTGNNTLTVGDNGNCLNTVPTNFGNAHKKI